MNETLDSLVRHGGLLVFLLVFVEQIGLPIPAAPWLLAAGALAGAGKMSATVAVAAGSVASLLADLIWFYLGRVQGRRILSLLCRLSLEPDSCVRHTEQSFSRHGTRALVVGKFVPGLSTVMPPLAGIFGVSAPRFLALDGLASLLYAGGFIALGLLFSNQLERVLITLGGLGHGALLVVFGLLAVYVGFKFVNRRFLLRKLNVARVTVDELRQKLAAGESLLVVDLRSIEDVKTDPVRIPNALHLPVLELERRLDEIPRDRDVVLYCSCPNEASSAQMALRLHQRGIKRVRPLAGGLDAWRQRNYPMDAFPGHT